MAFRTVRPGAIGSPSSNPQLFLSFSMVVRDSSARSVSTLIEGNPYREMTPRHLLEPGRLAGSALLKAQSDERLVDLTRAGNDRAFEAIVDRYKGQLLRYCARILSDGRGEDAVQQTFLNAYR